MPDEATHSAKRTQTLADEVASTLEETDTADDVWSERHSVNKLPTLKAEHGPAVSFRIENDELYYDVFVVPVD